MRNVIMLQTADKNHLGSSNNLSHFAHQESHFDSVSNSRIM